VLSLATNEARIQLVLRNPLDTKTAKTSGTALASLYGDALPAPIPRSRPVTMIRTVPAPKGQAPVILLPPNQVEVLNGSKRTALTFTRRMEEQQ